MEYLNEILSRLNCSRKANKRKEYDGMDQKKIIA